MFAVTAPSTYETGIDPIPITVKIIAGVEMKTCGCRKRSRCMRKFNDILKGTLVCRDHRNLHDVTDRGLQKMKFPFEGIDIKLIFFKCTIKIEQKAPSSTHPEITSKKSLVAFIMELLILEI